MKSRPQFIDVEKLEGVVDSLAGRFEEVEITGGGEPTLHREIDRVASMFMDRGIYTKMYTNGFLLRDLKVNELNISRVHWNSEINNEFYCSDFQNDLGEVLDWYRGRVDKIRMQTILLKGAIDSGEKILEFVEKFKDKVDVFMFRTLFPGCSLMKDYYVPYPEVSYEKVVFDRTLDDYSRELYFVGSDCEVSEDFKY